MHYPVDGIAILLIEENEHEKNRFIQVLETSGIIIQSITTASNFTEAEKILDLCKPEIIFSSSISETNNNIAFLKKIKENNSIIPLVTLSEETDERFPTTSLSIGADDHLFRNEISGAILRKTIQYSLERKKSREQLKEAIERFQLIAKATNDIAWDWDINKRNAQWMGIGIQDILNFKEQEIIVETDFWENHLHPDDKERVITKLTNIFKEAISNKWEDEYRFKDYNGNYRYIYDRGFIIFKNNVPVRMVGIMEDVTAKVLLENRLEVEKLLKQKQITEAVVTAQEKERTEIGKELHDNVNQLLTASRLYIDAAGISQHKGPFLLSQASIFIKNAIEEIRKLSKVLHTPLISELGLKETVKNLAEEIMAVSKLTIHLHEKYFDEEPLNYNFKLTIYRIIQEQLTNIIKHAKASDASITLLSNERFILLEIRDDGIGFDTKQERQGIGISNIYSRASMYNGRFKLFSEPQNGSTLCVRFPINDMLGHPELNAD